MGKDVRENPMLIAGFIQFVEETTWLSPIVILPKKNGKLKIYINFKKLNATTKKDPCPLGPTTLLGTTCAPLYQYFILIIFLEIF
jgi:hypothetical protein